jgi:hypothetical protein
LGSFKTVQTGVDTELKDGEGAILYRGELREV